MKYSPILDQYGKPFKIEPAKPRALTPNQKFDAARTNTDNRKHWANADGLSANAANSPEVRRTLRNRARYEDDNNSYASGLTGDLANETIGTGPRLQLALPESYVDPDFQQTVALADPEGTARAVELKWAAWCKATKLLDKLLLMDESETREGESFGFKFINPAVADAVQLDLRVYEADQIATPDLRGDESNAVDGIRFDANGNPVEYHVLKRHPGDAVGYGGTFAAEYDRVPARQMIHLFKPRRAGQARGIPAFTSSLPLYSILRRYTLASLGTAEIQARIAGFIESENRLPEHGDEAAAGDDECGGDRVEFDGVSFMTLDAGQKAKAVAASQPAPEYPGFKAEILTEAGRAVNAPRNVSRGSSADYNYSSGRLDQQQWQRKIRIRRARVEAIVLDALFAEWLALAVLIPGYLPDDLPPVSTWRKGWRWDGFVSIDPVKDAKAATERLTNGTSSLDRECGEMGDDWEEVQDQRLREEAREARRRKQLGLGPKVVATQPAAVSAPVEDDEGADPDA